MSIVIIAIPHAHAADEIEFVYTNNKRSGIKKIVIDGKTYYDIADGGSELSVSSFDFYVKALTKDYNNNSVADYCANIASLLFESAGTNYGYNDDSYSSDFDTFYTKDTEDNDRDLNLIEQLTRTEAFDSGRVHTTGFGVTNSLKGAQSAMVREIDDCYEQDVNDGNILRYTTGSSSGFAQMTEDSQDVVYNIVTTTDWDAGTTSFASFGIAFYDLKVVPLADDDLEFITAAEGYASLAEASQANAPGVTYNTTGNSTPFTSYITNPSAAEAVVTARYSEDSTTSVSNRIEETEVYSFAENISVATEFSASMPFVGDASISTSLGFTTEQIISTAFSTENTLTQTITNETTAQVTLPPHTQMGITQEAGSAEIKLDYDCPVYLTYKVMIFGMNGDLFLSAVQETWTTAQYDQGSVCVGFGTDTSIGGLDAVSNLYNRAVTNRSIAGFEETYGNVYGYWDKWSDGNGASNYSRVNWEGFINSKQNNGNDKTALQCIEGLRDNIPLSAAGAEMTVSSNSQNTSVSPITPLYDLDEVKVIGSSVFALRPGNMLDLGTVTTHGTMRTVFPITAIATASASGSSAMPAAMSSRVRRAFPCPTFRTIRL